METKDIDGFVTKAKTIGNCFVLRSLLAEAMEKQSQESIPYFYACVNDQISQIRDPNEKPLQVCLPHSHHHIIVVINKLYEDD